MTPGGPRPGLAEPGHSAHAVARGAFAVDVARIRSSRRYATTRYLTPGFGVHESETMGETVQGATDTSGLMFEECSIAPEMKSCSAIRPAARAHQEVSTRWCNSVTTLRAEEIAPCCQASR